MLANLEIEKSFQEKIKLQEESHEKETQILNLQKEILETELDQKRKELTAMAISMVDKNEYLLTLKEQAEAIGKSKPEDVGPMVRIIIRSINLNARGEESWQVFETQFKAIHRGFMEYLSSSYSELSIMELKVCSLLKINLSSKEMASILNISVRTIEDHRSNIRKKIGIDKDINLNQFITQINYKS